MIFFFYLFEYDFSLLWEYEYDFSLSGINQYWTSEQMLAWKAALAVFRNMVTFEVIVEWVLYVGIWRCFYEAGGVQ